MQAALAADGAADVDDTVDLGDFGRVLRTTGFEEFGHTGQTTGDVLGLGDLTRRTRPDGYRPETFCASFTSMCAPAGIE